MASFPQAFPPTPCAHLYPPPYAPHALPISFVSILPPNSFLQEVYGFEVSGVSILQNACLVPFKNKLKIMSSTYETGGGEKGKKQKKNNCKPISLLFWVVNKNELL
jgi:hypothetical protein